MPTNLPPLPPRDESWPPRPFDPAVVEEIRAALGEYDADHDKEAAVQRILRTLRRHQTPEAES